MLSPARVKAVGWKGVAVSTPLILLWGGGAFFAACGLFQYFFAATFTGAVPAASQSALDASAMWLRVSCCDGRCFRCCSSPAVAAVAAASADYDLRPLWLRDTSVCVCVGEEQPRRSCLTQGVCSSTEGSLRGLVH